MSRLAIRAHTLGLTWTTTYAAMHHIVWMFVAGIVLLLVYAFIAHADDSNEHR